MPSDSNGVYSLPSGYLAVTGQTIQASQHNPPLEDLAAAMTQRLMRSGAAPMTGPLKLVDGSAGSPSAQFANAPSTGVFKTANGIGFSVNGAQVAELVGGGFRTGARWIGELIPWTRTTAPPLCVMPYGQTLNRADYPDLWVVAQAEIAAGNTFYNNGNGSTTFGIGDLRGRVPAGKSNMGGTDNGVLAGGATLGALLGAQSIVLDGNQIPSHLHANFLTDFGHSHTASSNASGVVVGFGPINPAGGSNNIVPQVITIGTSASNIAITNAAAGGGQAHNNVQPTIITNYALFAGA